MSKLIEYNWPGLTKIISGGQVGADRGALEGAKVLNFPTGGTAPQGYWTANGCDPTLAEFGLVESPSRDYAVRTRDNVRDSDATLLIASDFNSPGTKLTMKICLELGKPHHICKLKPINFNTFRADQLADWLAKHSVSVLNVAGNRDPKDSENHFHHNWAGTIIIDLLLELSERAKLIRP